MRAAVAKNDTALVLSPDSDGDKIDLARLLSTVGGKPMTVSEKDGAFEVSVTAGPDTANAKAVRSAVSRKPAKRPATKAKRRTR